MAKVSSLGRQASIATAVALVVTTAVLVAAFIAAADARGRSHELSDRLVPAAALAGTLLVSV
jgi:hypothetical protein